MSDNAPATPEVSDDQKIVNAVQQYFEEAETARKPIKRVWDVSWALFNQQYDFSKKEAWQNKVPIPKISGAVRTVVALFKQALCRSADWFAVNTVMRNLKPYTPLVTGTLKYWTERIGFINIFAEAVHGALLSSLVVLKIYWVKNKKVTETDPRTNQVQTSQPSAVIKDSVERQFKASGFLGEMVETTKPYEQDGNLVVYAVDPYKFWVDPTGRGKYVIEEIEVDLDDLLATAKDKGYDLSEINKIQEDTQNTLQETEENRRKGQAIPLARPQFRKKVKIREFWGDINDDAGKRKHTNVNCVIADDKYLIRKPTTNPFWHKQYPYVWGPIIRKPFSVWHKGFTEDLHGIQLAITELACAILDSNLLATLRAFELDMDLVADPEQFKNGIWPGKTYKKHGAVAGGQNSRLIQEVEIGAFVPQSIRILLELDRTFQNESIATEFVSGGTGARGRSTATEVVSKTNQANTLIQDIAGDVENYILGPALEMIFYVCLQYQRNFDDERYQQFVDQELLNRVMMMSPDERKEFMDDQFVIKVAGISGYINRVSQVQKFQILTQIFQYAPDLIQWFKKESLLKNVVEWLNWDPEDMLYSEEEMKQRMAAEPAAPAANQPQAAQAPGGYPPEIQALMSGLGG